MQSLMSLWRRGVALLASSWKSIAQPREHFLLLTVLGVWEGTISGAFDMGITELVWHGRHCCVAASVLVRYFGLTAVFASLA
jgi:hypothetical protein